MYNRYQYYGFGSVFVFTVPDPDLAFLKEYAFGSGIRIPGYTILLKNLNFDCQSLFGILPF
jgi:hypothetical protein